MADQVNFAVAESGTPPPPCPSGYHWDATANACVVDTPTPDYRVPLIIAGAIGIGAVAYLGTRKKQKKPVK